MQQLLLSSLSRTDGSELRHLMEPVYKNKNAASLAFSLSRVLNSDEWLRAACFCLQRRFLFLRLAYK